MTAARTPPGAPAAAAAQVTAFMKQERRRKIAALQIARKALAIDEDDWRTLLTRATGVASVRAMNDAQIGSALKEMERLGWTPEAHGGGGRWRPKAQHAHQRKVYALWGALKRMGVWRVDDVASLRGFVRRVAGAHAPEWLTPEQATKVIEAFKDMAERAGERLE